MKSTQLDGFNVKLDKLVYEVRGDLMRSYTFQYYLRIQNHSDRNIKILGRKWVVDNHLGEIEVVEGEGVIGKKPAIRVGEEFQYNSCHLTTSNALARGVFYGIDEFNNPIHTSVIEISMNVQDNF